MKTPKIKETKTHKRRSIKTSRKLGVKLIVKIQHGATLLWTSKKTKLAEFLAQLTEEQWVKGVDVIVRYQKGVTNSGTYHDITLALADVKTFLEPDLVEYATDDKW